MGRTAERLLAILAQKTRYATHGTRELYAARELAQAGKIDITEQTEWAPARHGQGHYTYTNMQRVTIAVCTLRSN